tara:strand:+ start:2266 stop:2451 length:186 start_codon:yes stop_codon:yes gene_type:complete
MNKTLEKPKHLMDKHLDSKKMSIKTPIGTIESDSGNHTLDVMSIAIIICVFIFMKKFYEAT